MNLKNNDIITISGKTDFGKSFVKENGPDFKIIKVETWGEYQLLISPINKKSEIRSIWINLLPESKNFKIDKVKE